MSHVEQLAREKTRQQERLTKKFDLKPYLYYYYSICDQVSEASLRAEVRRLTQEKKELENHIEQLVREKTRQQERLSTMRDGKHIEFKVRSSQGFLSKGSSRLNN